MNLLNLDVEGGITRIALANGRKLKEALGTPVRMELHYDAEGMEWYQTKVFYMTGETHVFTGFGWGYTGEGPHGLAEFCADNGIPLTLERIAMLNNQTTEMVWSWPSHPNQAQRRAHPEDA